MLKKLLILKKINLKEEGKFTLNMITFTYGHTHYKVSNVFKLITKKLMDD